MDSGYNNVPPILAILDISSIRNLDRLLVHVAHQRARNREHRSPPRSRSLAALEGCPCTPASTPHCPSNRQSASPGIPSATFSPVAVVVKTPPSLAAVNKSKRNHVRAHTELQALLLRDRLVYPADGRFCRAVVDLGRVPLCAACARDLHDAARLAVLDAGSRRRLRGSGGRAACCASRAWCPTARRSSCASCHLRCSPRC